MKRFGIILGITIVPATLAIAQVPRLNVEATCRETPAINLDQQATYDNCMRSENAARDKLRDNWGNIRADWRSSCLNLTRLGGIPSYVELLTCVEMREAAATGQKGLGITPAAGAATGSGSPNSNSETSGASTGGAATSAAPGQSDNDAKTGVGTGSAGATAVPTKAGPPNSAGGNDSSGVSNEEGYGTLKRFSK